MLRKDNSAKDKDTDILNERFKAMEKSHMELRRTLGNSPGALRSYATEELRNRHQSE